MLVIRMHNVFALLIATFKRLRPSKKPRSAECNSGNEKRQITKDASEPVTHVIEHQIVRTTWPESLPCNRSTVSTVTFCK